MNDLENRASAASPAAAPGRIAVRLRPGGRGDGLLGVEDGVQLARRLAEADA